MKFQVLVFWVVKSWRWRHHSPPKLWSPATPLDGVTSQRPRLVTSDGSLMLTTVLTCIPDCILNSFSGTNLLFATWKGTCKKHEFDTVSLWLHDYVP